LHYVEESHLTIMLSFYFKLKWVNVSGTFKMKNAASNIDEGDLDLQTTDLPINYVIEITRDTDGDWKRIEKFKKYVKLESFRAGINYQSKMYLLILTFHRKRDREHVASWIRIPYEYTPLNDANPEKNLKFDQMTCSNSEIKLRVLKKMNH